MKDNLFRPEQLEKIKKMRKVFLWAAVWILIGELALGAILILAQSWNISVGKIQGTFLILALVLFVGVNNFIRMENGDKKMQVFALIGFISNIIWALLAILLIWEALPFYWEEEVREMSEYARMGYYSYTKYHMTFFSMLMVVAACSAAAGFWISNIMAIKETIKTVKPLKITAIVCIFYGWVYGVISTVAELEYSDAPQLHQLSALAGLAFCATALAAWIISRTNDKDRKNENGKIRRIKTEEELRAEIEEQVRREMIEKEVRAKYENDKAKDSE